MSNEYLEHANITITDMDRAIRFIQAAVPSWQIRGHGRMEWFGKPIQWLHIGNDNHYLALQDGGEGEGLPWKSNAVGVKHIGLVVPSLAAAMARLQEAGFELDHMGGRGTYRVNAYFQLGDELQFELVEYSSDKPHERNEYGLS